MAKAVYEIDGHDFSTLEGFYGVVSRVLIPGAEWGHNLDAFDDILRGGFGTPDGGFILRWKNAHVSRERLGHPETVRQLEGMLARSAIQPIDGSYVKTWIAHGARSVRRCSTGWSRSFRHTVRAARSRKTELNSRLIEAA